jgi:signal recognition particle subunit SRP72
LQQCSQKSKTDLEAQHVKVVALLKLDRYDDALRVIEAGGDKLKERIPLEQAYAQYKLGNYVEAAKIANVAGGERASSMSRHRLYVATCPSDQGCH